MLYYAITTDVKRKHRSELRCFSRIFVLTLGALYSQETVAWVFVNSVAARQVAAFWALVLRKVKNLLQLAAAKSDLFAVQIVGDTL
jgi:hypothetical protein